MSAGSLQNETNRLISGVLETQKQTVIGLKQTIAAINNSSGGGTPVNYNTVTYYTLAGATAAGSYTGSVTTPITIAANTVHSLGYIVIAGTGTVNFGSGAQTIGAGESNSVEASTLITNAITFTTVSADFVVKITTLS